MPLLPSLIHSTHDLHCTSSYLKYRSADAIYCRYKDQGMRSTVNSCVPCMLHSQYVGSFGPYDIMCSFNSQHNFNTVINSMQSQHPDCSFRVCCRYLYRCLTFLIFQLSTLAGCGPSFGELHLELALTIFTAIIMRMCYELASTWTTYRYIHT